MIGLGSRRTGWGPSAAKLSAGGQLFLEKSQTKLATPFMGLDIQGKIRPLDLDRSAMVMGQSGEKELLISQISAIQLKKPDTWAKGFIQFTLIGGREERSAAWDIARDENCVIFTQKELSDFEEFKKKVQELMEIARQPKSTAPSYLEELEKLGLLRERGVITEDEFQAKKKQLLGV